MKRNRTIRRRGLALLLSLVMCLGMLPGTAWAAERSGEVWDGITKTEPQGAGTLADPYQISNGAELAWVAESVNTRSSLKGLDNTFYKLTADIDLGGHSWTPIGNETQWSPGGSTSFKPYFGGKFIGNGHTIKNLNVSKQTDGNAGLFGYVVGAVICDMTIDGATVSDTYAGSFVGTGFGSTRLCNLHAMNVSVASPNSAGGIVGFLAGDGSGTPTVCDSSMESGTVTAPNNALNYAGVGGIVGYIATGYVDRCRCEADATISAYRGAAGGILGKSGTFGGMASGGSSHVDIKDCYNKAPVTVMYTGQMYSGWGASAAGGIAGYIHNSICTVKYCYNTGDVTVAGSRSTSEPSYAGGIVGYDVVSQILNCANMGKVSTSNTASRKTNAAPGVPKIGVISGRGNKDSTCRYLTGCLQEGTPATASKAGLFSVNSPSSSQAVASEEAFIEATCTLLKNSTSTGAWKMLEIGLPTLKSCVEVEDEECSCYNPDHYYYDSGIRKNDCGCYCAYHAPTQPEAKQLTDIQKAQIESIPETVTNAAAELSLSEKKDGKYIIKDGKVTLLYSITVTGDEGAKYIVTDEGAVWVGGDGEQQADKTITGTIAEGETQAVIYVTKEFTVAEGSTSVTNQAFLEAGDDTELKPDDPNRVDDGKLPSEEVPTNVTPDGEEEPLKLTDFSKVRVTDESSVPAGINTDGINFDDQVVAAAGGSVTLLYKITVTGEAGAKYDVSDENADRVGGAELTGTIGASESAVIYVTKTFDDVTADTELTNTAILRPGEGTELGPADEADQDKPTPDPDDPEKKFWEESSDPASPAVLDITKSVDKSAAEVGDELTYTVTVTNSGNEDVTGVTVTDTLPDGVDFVRAGQRGSYVSDDRTVTWSNQTVPAKSGEENGKLELTLTVRAKAEGAIANTAHLTSPVTTDSSEVTTSVGPKSNRSIKVTKKMGNAVVDADAGTATVEYTVTVTNIGNVDLYGLRVDDTLTTKVKTSQAKMTIKPVSGYVGEETDSNVTVNGETERSWTLIDRNETFAVNETKELKYQLVLENTGDEALSVDLENTAVGGAWSKQASAPSGDPSQPAGRRAVRLSNDDPDITDEGSASGSNIGSSSGSVEIPVKPQPSVEYKLTFDANTGTPGTATELTATTREEEHTFTIPETAKPFKSGFVFRGWADSRDATVAVYSVGGEITLEKASPNKTIYAVWEAEKEPDQPVTFTVTWIDRLAPDTPIKTQQVTDLKDAVYPEHPAHKGYQGSGWSRPEADENGNYIIYAEYVELHVDPGAPSYEYLRNELNIRVKVECETNETHSPLDYEVPLKAGSYSADVNGDRCIITIAPDLYVAECDGNHSITGIAEETIELVYVEPEPDIDTQSDDQMLPNEQDGESAPDGEEMPPVQAPDEPNNAPNDALNNEPSDTPDGDITDDTQIPDNTNGSTEPPANGGEDAGTDEDGEPVEFFALALAGEEEAAGSWQLADGESGVVTFSVYCEKQEPDEPETVTVTVTWLDGEGGNELKTAEVEVPRDNPTHIPGTEYPGAPTRDGYRFTGWSDPVDNGDGTITITAQWEALPDESQTVTVTWQNWNGDLLARENWNQDDPEPSYPGRRPTRPDSSRYTYTFDGWDREVDDDGNVTYTARFDRERIDDDDIGGGGGGTGGGTTTTPPATNIPDADVPQGDTTNITDDQTPLAGAIGLNNTEHFAYMIGYDNGTVGPMNQITRAEVATIFFRLMDDSFRSQYWSTVSGFSDVTAGKWFNNAVSTATNAGKLTGYPDGTFRPNQSITRAEFAAIAVRFLSDEVQGVSGGNFSDTEGHWAADAIGRAAAAGWIAGYPDGTFRPNAPITRAEAATIINNMLGRAPDKEHLLDDMIVWPDNPETAWYYEAIQEATNSHDYERDELGVTEIWSAIQTVRDWKALEEQWAA